MSRTRFTRSKLEWRQIFVVGTSFLWTFGCSSSEIQVELQASFPDHTPLAGLEIMALPFDRDGLRDSLAAEHESERPTFPELEAELSEYELPDLTGLEDVTMPWRAIHDSVTSLADSLNSVGSDSSVNYAAAYARLGDQYRRLARTAVDREAVLRERIGDDRQLASRAAAAADSLRRWEAVVLAEYPALADSAISRSGRTPQVTTTDSDGKASLTLAPGPWWFVAVRVDPNNPYQEYYWNVGIGLSRWWGSRTVTIDANSGTTRWRR